MPQGNQRRNKSENKCLFFKVWRQSNEKNDFRVKNEKQFYKDDDDDDMFVWSSCGMWYFLCGITAASVFAVSCCNSIIPPADHLLTDIGNQKSLFYRQNSRPISYFYAKQHTVRTAKLIFIHEI